MRLFLQTVYERKKSRGGMKKLIDEVRNILERKNLKEDKVLFEINSVSDAKTIPMSPRGKIAKKYPHLEKYIYPYEQQSVAAIISNLPSYNKEKIIYTEEKDIKSMEEIFCNYATFGSILVLDNIKWLDSSNLTPFIDFSNVEEEKGDFLTPDTSQSFQVDIGFRSYCSNSIIFSQRFDVSTYEISINVEITSEDDHLKANELLKEFEEIFGKPRKQFMKPSIPYEDIEMIEEKYKEMKVFLDGWLENIRGELYSPITIEGKLPTSNTIIKKFLKDVGYERFPVKSWDDYSWHKRHKENYYTTIEFNGARYEILGENFYYMFEFALPNQENIKEENETYKYICEKTKYFSEEFEKDVIPKLVQVFGKSQDIFKTNSYMWLWSERFRRKYQDINMRG